MDTHWLVMKAPRLLQALFAAAGDYYQFQLATIYWGNHAAQWAIFCQLCNWFTFFCMVRTLSNCLETVLTVASLYYWAIGEKFPRSKHFCLLTARQWALFLAALACIMRPTSAVIWIYIGLMGLFKSDEKVQLLMEAIFIGTLTLGVSCLIDRWMYGKWILVPLNFLRFNFLESGGDYYGTHPWHWYFSQGFPAIILTFMPLSILGIWWSRKWQIAGLIVWVLSVYSFLGHKEFRFILPILPLALMFAGYALANMPNPSENLQSCSGSGLANWFIYKQGKGKFWRTISVLGLLATNVPLALYTSTIHQRGSEVVMQFLADEIDSGHAKNVVFLMPCHSTPYYSYLHANISLRFLDCTPSKEAGYVDESDRFMAEPTSFAQSFLKDQVQLPSHLIIYDSMETSLSGVFKSYGYNEVIRIFHAHFPVDHGLINYVLVYRLGDLLNL